MANSALDVNRALMLRGLGLTWDGVGATLSNEDWRDAPYQGNSVRNAVIRHLRRAAGKHRSEEYATVDMRDSGL